jgi:hypothetical protein
MGGYFAPDTIGGRAYFAPDVPPVAATTSVSADLVCSYAVRAAVSADLVAAYAVRSQVSADLVGYYRLLSSVQVSASFAYNVTEQRSPVEASFEFSYQVAEPEAPFTRSVARTYLVPGDETATDMPSFRVAVGSKLDYSFDWTKYLEAVGDIATSMTIDGPVALGLSGKRAEGSVATTWARPAVAGYRHMIRCEITTLQGRVDSRAIAIEVVAQR